MTISSEQTSARLNLFNENIFDSLCISIRLDNEHEIPLALKSSTMSSFDENSYNKLIRYNFSDENELVTVDLSL